jgi:vitamin B12 transporter
LDRLLLTAGLRQDSYNVFGDATTYRVTGGYLIPETGTKLRASYATGFRTPTINQLFFPGFGNPNLKPEESKSLDAGIEQRLLKDRLQLSARYFWNRFQNLIVNVPAGALLRPENVGQTKSQGWEASFQYAVFKNLGLRGQYTYTLTRDLSTGNRLPRWPVHQAVAGLSYQPIEAIRIHLDYRYVGRASMM